MLIPGILRVFIARATGEGDMSGVFLFLICMLFRKELRSWIVGVLLEVKHAQTIDLSDGEWESRQDASGRIYMWVRSDK